jgi:hypothetical protein
MGIDDIAFLESKVTDLLADADKLKAYIEAHEFDMARVIAEGLSWSCELTNKIANKLADKE